MRTRKLGIQVLSAAALATALLFAACGQKADHKESSESSEAAALETVAERPTYSYQSEESQSDGLRRFRDASGREVAVKADITRVAVLSTDAQSYLYMIAPEKLVSVWHNAKQEEYIDAAYRGLTAIGNVKASEQKDTLLSFAPEVIIYMSDGNEKETGTGAMAEKLQTEFGVPVVEIDSSFAGQGNAFRMLGDLLGKRERGEELGNYMDSVYRKVEAVAVSGKDKTKLLCFRGAAGNQVLPKSAKASEIVNMLADNLAEISGTEAQQRSGLMILEADEVKELNPSVIITDTESFLQQINSDSSWQELTAVKNTQVYKTPTRPRAWLFTPAQYPIGALWLAKTLYPAASNFDLEQEVKQYYQTCYGKSLSTEEYEALYRAKQHEH